MEDGFEKEFLEVLDEHDRLTQDVEYYSTVIFNSVLAAVLLLVGILLENFEVLDPVWFMFASGSSVALLAAAPLRRVCVSIKRRYWR